MNNILTNKVSLSKKGGLDSKSAKNISVHSGTNLHVRGGTGSCWGRS